MTDTPWSKVLEICRALLPPAEHEQVARRNSLGRLLLEIIVSDRDYPTDNLSTMDGYAISEEPNEVYRVVGENCPGQGSGLPLEPGTARRIFTGAALPQNATRVIPQEITSREGDLLTVQSIPPARYIRFAGTEGKKGVPTLHPGIRITPAEQSLLATLGVGDLCVAKRPVIAHLATGDELSDPDAPLSGSMIRDSNSELIEASLRQAGYSIAYHRRIGDDKDILTAQIEEATKTCNFLLVSGGASVGDHDYTRAALEAVGYHFEVHGVHLRPGKPIGIARRGNQWAIALPGNPVSHLVALHLFVQPLLRGLEGEKQSAPIFLDGILQRAPSTGVPRRPTFWPARVAIKDGTFHLDACRFSSSGDLIGIAGTNALLYLEENVDVPAIGAKISFVPLNILL